LPLVARFRSSHVKLPFNNPMAKLNDKEHVFTEQKPILGYWEIRGLAAQIRYMFAYCEVDYEDLQYPAGAPDSPTFKENWVKTKPTLKMNFPNLPFLLDNGHNMSETSAIMRYIANKYKPELLGRTSEEKAIVAMVESKVGDLKSAITRPCYMGDKSPEQLRKDTREMVVGLEKWVKGKKFLAGEEFTYVDFILYELLELTELAWEKHMFRDHANLKAYH